jgi:peptidyl-prolyl cis-trans isomerase D
MFEMTVGETRVIPADTEGAIILRLDDIAPADLTAETNAAQREQLAANAAAGIAQEVFDAYATSVQERTELNINQATVNAVNAQFQ